MLPEFPRAQQAIQKVWNRLLFDAAGGSNPLVSKIPVRVQKEGHRAFWGDSEIKYKRESVSCQWKFSNGKGMPTEDFFEMPEKLGREIAMGQEQRLLEVLSTEPAKSQNIERREGPITFDLFVKKMESMEVNFDSTGMPKWPMWILEPEAIKEFTISMGNLTTEQMEQLARLIETKRKEFDERTSRRRLVE